jgi:hypothetical protein
MRRMWTCLLLLAALAVISLPARAYDEVVDRSYPLAPEGSVELQNVNGSVQITGWDRDVVDVRAVKKTQDDAADLLRVRIRVSATPDQVSIETHYPKDKGVAVSVEYFLRVPRHALLRRIKTVNGAVRVRRMDGKGELRSVNGNVEILDSAGGFNAHTTNGDLRIELRHLDPATPFDGRTVNGSVVVALAPNAGATLEVRTLNGDFRSDLPVYMKNVSNLRQFQAILGGGGTPLTLRTVNGAIRIIALHPRT